MKKVNKMLMVVALAATTMLSSCIKNEVAPEVTALRQAQLDMITAKIEMQNLLNEQQRIENLITQSDADLQQVLDDLEEQRATADLQQELAYINYQVRQYETFLQQQELQYQQAVDALAEYLTDHALDEAANYLANYSDYMSYYFDNLQEIYGQEANIAGLQAAMAQDDFVLAAQIIQRDIDSKMAEMTGMQTSLTALEAVATDPSSAEAELADFNKKIDSLISANLLLDIDIEKLTNDQNDATDAFEAAEDMITIMDGGVFNNDQSVNALNWMANDSYEGLTQALANASDTQGLQDDIDNIDSDIAVEEQKLSVEETTLANASANYDAKVTALDAAKVAEKAAQDDEDAAQAALDLEQLDYDIVADALTTAQNDLTSAESDLTTAQNDLSAATDAIDADAGNAQATLDSEEAQLATDLSDLNTAIADYNADPTGANLTAMQNAQTTYDNQLVTVANAQADVDALANNLADAQAEITAANAAVTAATTALSAAEAAEVTALAALQVKIDARDAATVIRVAATDAKNIAKNAEDAAKTVWQNAQSDVDARLNTLGGYIGTGDPNDAANWTGLYADQLIAQQALADANETIADVTAAIAAHQADYDAAVANIAALQTAMDAAIVANTAAVTQQGVNNALNGQYQDVANAIDNFLTSGTGINAEIENLKDDIEAKQMEINDLEKDLADSAIDEAELTAQIAAEQEDLQRMQDERDANLDLANEYWALYLAAIGG